MITQGTYSELQGSGIDFTSLLKEDQEEERQDVTPLPGPGTFHYTLSDNSSMSSLSSSLYSLIDGGDSLTLVKYNSAVQHFSHWRAADIHIFQLLFMCIFYMFFGGKMSDT